MHGYKIWDGQAIQILYTKKCAHSRTRKQACGGGCNIIVCHSMQGCDVNNKVKETK